MRAVTIAEGQLLLAERDIEAPVADQVLIDVAGAGVNRGDLLQLAGRYPAPAGAPPDIPGLEFSGIVRSVGPLVQSIRPGDPVFGIVGGGGQAEQLLTTEDLCARVPSQLDLVEAGGIPEVFITAHDALVAQAAVRPGDRVLVHAVGSGVGTAAVQIAAALGCEVVGTARTASKLERARALGMSRGILVGPRPDPVAIAEAAGPCQVIIDLVGGDYLDADLRAADSKGRIVVVGLIAGGSASMNVATLLFKRARIIGTVLRSRTRAEKAAATAAFCTDVVPLLAQGRIRPITDRVVPMEEAQAAYQLLRSNATFGKVILTPGHTRLAPVPSRAG